MDLVAVDLAGEQVLVFACVALSSVAMLFHISFTPLTLHIHTYITSPPPPPTPSLSMYTPLLSLCGVARVLESLLAPDYQHLKVNENANT